MSDHGYGQKLYHSPAVADFVDEIKNSFFRFMSIPDFVDDGARYFCVIRFEVRKNLLDCGLTDTF